MLFWCPDPLFFSPSVASRGGRSLEGCMETGQARPDRGTDERLLCAGSSVSKCIYAPEFKNWVKGI